MTDPAPARSVHEFAVLTIDGEAKSLADYEGKVLLIVNTASKCGFTSQYESLESLYGRYRDRGFEVLAFPANDFMGQEPGTNEEIREFCATNYTTTFPLFAKISVKGKRIHPLYDYLTRASGFPGAVSWNFNKFLVGPDGRVTARWGSPTDPLAKAVTSKIEALLPARS
ncbi:MAG TPA: glutathione peroxidase [Acidobacteriota bacterium]|nr:glutathione peroxidase [Acidobacteriota bacterium]